MRPGAAAVASKRKQGGSTRPLGNRSLARARDRDAIVDAACQRIRNGTPIRNAFLLEDVPESTAHDWLTENEGWRLKVDKARAEASEARRIRFEEDPSNPFLHFMRGQDPKAFPEPAKEIALSGGAVPIGLAHQGPQGADGKPGPIEVRALSDDALDAALLEAAELVRAKRDKGAE